MSSAVDTLDHNILIHRLSTIGITGIALNWFTSYISNSSSTIWINSHSYPPALSPRVFLRVLFLVLSFLTLTSSPCSKSLLTTHTFPFIPTPMTFNSTSTEQISPTHAPNRLLSCINSIHQWLISNSLKLNPTITESIFIHIPLSSSILPEPPPPH